MSVHMYRYKAFGLKISSDLELPELSPDESATAPDVTIRVERIDPASQIDRAPYFYSAECQILPFAGLGRYTIKGTSDILVEVFPESPANLIAFPLLGPVFGLLLHLRKRFVLHASAVQFAESGIGFLGDKGAGKSTLAAMLIREPGVSLLTDDLLVFDEGARILPSFPQIKLAPDALEVFRDSTATLRPPPVDNFPKRQLRLASETPAGAVRARALYELRRDSHPRIERLPAPEALQTLMRFSYFIRFSQRHADAQERRRIFEQVMQIVGQVSVRRLYVPEALENLPSAATLLFSDAAGEGR